MIATSFRSWRAIIAIGVVLVLGLSTAAARYGHELELWDLPLGAEVGTALGTTFLAIATFALALGVRRPRLQLLADAERLHSHLEGVGNDLPHLRLLVSNAPGKRAARGTRVLVDGYWPRGSDEPPRTLGSPSLGWPSAPEAFDASVVVFGGGQRPVGLGELVRLKPGQGTRFEETTERFPDGRQVRIPRPFPDSTAEPEATWHLRLSLSHDLAIADRREWLSPDTPWTVALVVGSDEADGRRFLVDVYWDGDAPSAEAALHSLTATVREVSFGTRAR